jgi:predicted DNA-binding mobile mystery protein A
MDLKRLRAEQVESALAATARLRDVQRPGRGWLRAVRDALGVTTRQMARRLGIAQAAYVKAEANEATGAISLKQLRRIAEALDCELVYAIVPRRSLIETVEERATQLARERVSRVAHTMALEDQGTAPEVTEAQVSEIKRELLSGRWSRLWE